MLSGDELENSFITSDPDSLDVRFRCREFSCENTATQTFIHTIPSDVFWHFYVAMSAPTHQTP